MLRKAFPLQIISLYLRTDCLTRGLGRLGTVLTTGLCLGFAGWELHEAASCDWRVVSANKTRNMLQLPGRGCPTPRFICDSYSDEICDVDISYYLEIRYHILNTIRHRPTLPRRHTRWHGLSGTQQLETGDIHYIPTSGNTITPVFCHGAL